MTSVATARETAISVVTDFFSAYGRHDVNRMVDLCADNADLSYVPFEIWGRQRVLRGDGKVCTIGKPLWNGMISAFSDLKTEVTSITASDGGRVAAEVTISGTQNGDWGPITARGKVFSLPHMFLIDVDDDCLIAAVTGYWDNASMYRQLGHLEVD